MPMYNSGFALTVRKDGEFLREKNSFGRRLVFLPFGSEYSLFLKNKTNKKAKFQVRIDGKLTAPDDNWYVIYPHNTFDLERFMLDGDHSSGERFKFVNVHGSGEEPGKAENGVITVTVKLEKPNRTIGHPRSIAINKYSTREPPPVMRSRPDSPLFGSNTVECDNLSFDCMDRVTMTNCSVDSAPPQEEGVTVGGSHSGQQFNSVEDFETDRTIVMKLQLKPVKYESPLVDTDTCPACYGNKYQTNTDGIRVRCPMCNGIGRVEKSLAYT